MASDRIPSDNWLQRIDIFISSPSDVQEERNIILRVIEKLNRLSHIRRRYVLNPLLYESEVPPEAGDIAPVIVDRYMAVEDSYLLVCLMWNRMGTPFTHPDTGKTFRSGTEYEFTVGYEAKERNGRPHILLYRKVTKDPHADPKQKQEVDEFFKRFDGGSAKFKGLYKTFSSASEFEELIFEHIERLLDEHPPDKDYPDFIEETRRLDAAIPRECQVGKRTEVRVMICLPESEGLSDLLPAYTTEGDLIDKRDVRHGNLAVVFPVNKATGDPKPILVSVGLKATDFDIDTAMEIQLTPRMDSGSLTFGLTPLEPRRRSRVHITVKSKTPDGNVVVLGSASLDTEIKPAGVRLVAQVMWNVLSLPLYAVSNQQSENFTAQIPLLRWCEIPGGMIKPRFFQNNNLPDDMAVEVGSFFMSKYPITNQQYQQFIDSPNGYANLKWWEFSPVALKLRENEPGPQYPAFAGDERPREMVSWYNAVAYCNWLGDFLGLDIRLPTISEWQFALQGSGNQRFPWGDEFNEDYCNTSESRLRMTTQVTRYPQNVSPFGVQDMVGNVWEWCLDHFDEKEPAETLEQEGKRIITGGSYASPSDRSEAGFYYKVRPEVYYASIGFRVVYHIRPFPKKY